MKKWVLGVLACIGLITIASVAPLDLYYIPATAYEDNTPLSVEQIAETRLYCSGELVMIESGADGIFENVDSFLTVGSHQCYATHLATNALESIPSNSVTIIVQPTSPPKPPVIQ